MWLRKHLKQKSDENCCVLERFPAKKILPFLIFCFENPKKVLRSCQSDVKAQKKSKISCKSLALFLKICYYT